MPRGPSTIARPSLREERAQRTRERLIAGARALIMSSGLPEVSLEDVARAAGVTRVTVYNQFKSRRGLLEAVLQDTADRGVFSRLGTTVNRRDPRAALRDTLREFSRIWSTDEVGFRRVLGLAEVDPEMKDAFAPRDTLRRGTSHTLTVRLAEAKRIRRGWSVARADALLYMLTDFTTYQRLRAGGLAGHAEVADVLIALAGVAFEI